MDAFRDPNEMIGPDGKTPLPSLIVVRIICVVTKLLMGIGFSFGGETAAAYRAALFCMAISKPTFGRLMGIDISASEWTSEGLCDDVVTDRGAGGGEKAQAHQEVGNAVIRSSPPTGFGQGKAVMESSNPRKVKVNDRQSHRRTSLSLTDVMRRHIQQTITDNDSRDISGRITPSMVEYLDRLTPLALYNELSQRGRNSLRRIAFVEAVRAFLTPVKLVAKADGIYLRYQRYVATDLDETGILQSAASTGRDIVLEGYCLDACVRYCFLEWQGKIIELSAVLALREDDEQLYISLHQLEQTNAVLQKMKSDLRVHSSAVRVEGRREFAEKTGVPPEQITVHPGPKRKGRGSEQSKIVKNILTHAELD
jgi:hypothetical protein